MSALGKVVRAGVGRRRVQTLVMTLTTMMAVAASVLAAGLIVASRAPFDQAFARQHGAHLTARFDGGAATAAQIAATSGAAGVTAAAGPFPVLSLAPESSLGGPGSAGPPITVAGRSGPGGDVDAVDLVEGRWATGAGEIVLSPDGEPHRLGDRVAFPDAPGRPALTVVGLARSVGRSADAWVAPAQLTRLSGPDASPGYQMLYRFAGAATGAGLTRGRAAIAAASPPGSLTGAQSYLNVKLAAEREMAVYVPFVVAFGVLGLCMSVLTIGVVVNGAVGAATRRIGVLKSLGFTPAQVVRAYVGQALIPAVIGTVLGVGLGNLLAVPALRQEGDALGTGAGAIPLWVDAAVAAGALAAVAITALVPASRAGRLRAAEAIVVGRAPKPGRGRAIRRLLGRLPLPRPVSIGLAVPFARPARSAAMGVAVALGVVAVTFTAGLALSLDGVQSGLDRRAPGAVEVQTFTPPPPGSAEPPKIADAAAVGRAIDAQPGTRRHFRTVQGEVGVAGLAGATTLIAYAGDSAWGSYEMISGSWFGGPGEAVVPSGFLKATGTRVGDTVTLTNGGRQARVRLVGEVFDLRDEGMEILTAESSLSGLGVRFDPPSTRFHVDVTPGADRDAYLSGLNRALRPIGAEGLPNTAEVSSTVIAMNALAGMLTALLVAVAALGVLNTVVLDSRERVRELGVLKALGMSPRQTVAMLVTTVAAVGLVAGAVGVPIGMAVHAVVMPMMGRAAGTGMPDAYVAVYDAPLPAALLLGGAAIAVAGALLPAGWAARSRTATALRAE